MADNVTQGSILPPGPRLPKSVQALSMGLAMDGFTRACRRRYGDTFTLSEPWLPPVVWSSDPALARYLTRLPTEVSGSRELNGLAEFLWGPRSPFIVEGEEHRHKRRLMMPLLRGPRMLESRDHITQATRKAVATWPRGRTARMWTLMRELVLDLVIRSVFGPSPDPLAARAAVLTETLRQTASSPLLLTPWTRRLPGSSYGSVLRTRRQLVDCIVSAVRMRSRGDGGDGLLGDLTRACTDGRLTEEALPDQVIAFLLGAYATTASALTSTFDLLLHHPQALARTEDELLDRDRTGGKSVHSDAWLDLVVQESLRVNPPAWIYGRSLRQPVEFAQWVLPAGALVAFDVLTMHRQRNLFPPDVDPGDPQTFRPERYLARGEVKQQCPSPASFWSVFGGGSRTCPGSSFGPFLVRTVLAEVLVQARLHPTRKQPGRLVRQGTLLMVGDGVPVTVVDR